MLTSCTQRGKQFHGCFQFGQRRVSWRNTDVFIVGIDPVGESRPGFGQFDAGVSRHLDDFLGTAG